MTITTMTEQGSKNEQGRRLRRKNLALMGALLAWVVILYFVAILRMGAGA